MCIVFEVARWSDVLTLFRGSSLMRCSSVAVAKEVTASGAVAAMPREGRKEHLHSVYRSMQVLKMCR